MDPAQEAVLKKIAWRIVPLLTLAYIVNYLDRTNIGFAALTMNKDLGFTATEFGIGAGVLFIGYTVFEVPSNLALYRFGARRWIARIMITWGLVSALTALVVGVKSYYLARFALGVAEAGFFPGVAYYFAAWFPTQYRTRMLAWFLVAIPLSSVVGGPISGLLLELDGVFGLRGWQWLFIVEGIPAVILGIVVLRVLADRPETATWLSGKERDILKGMLDAERRERPKSSLSTALSDVRVGWPDVGRVREATETCNDRFVGCFECGLRVKPAQEQREQSVVVLRRGAQHHPPDKPAFQSLEGTSAPPGG